MTKARTPRNVPATRRNMVKYARDNGRFDRERFARAAEDGTK